MFRNEINKYKALNDLAEQGGIVILGGSEDKEIPLCELKQAFALDMNLYNRSISGLALENAEEIYESCVAELIPDTVFVHIKDAELFAKDPVKFDQKYCGLIDRIRKRNPKCNVVVVSLKNYLDDAKLAEINKHLKYIADSERCEFADISAKRVWNPRETKEVVSFVYSTGFIKPLRNKRPVYELVKILFCYES